MYILVLCRLKIQGERGVDCGEVMVRTIMMGPIANAKRKFAEPGANWPAQSALGQYFDMLMIALA